MPHTFEIYFRNRTFSSNTDYIIYLLAFLTIISIYLKLYVPIQVMGTTIFISSTRVLLFTLGLVATVRLIQQGFITVSKSTIGLFLFVIVTVCSSYWSLYPSASLNWLIGVLLYASLYLAVLTTPSNKTGINRWIKILVLAGVVSMAAWHLGTLANYHLLAHWQNLTAKRLIVFIPLSIFLYHRANLYIIRLFYLLLTVLAIATVIFTGSRSGLMSTLIIFVLISILLLLEYRVQSNIFTGAVGLFGVALFAGLLGAILTLFSVLFDQIPLLFGVDKTTIGVQRYRMYLFFLETFRNNWSLGIGFGVFRQAMAQRYGAGVVPHGLFLRIFSGVGVLGFIPCIFAIVHTLREYILSRSKLDDLQDREGAFCTSSLAIALFGLLIIGLFNPIITEPSLYILLALSTNSQDLSS